MIVRMKRLTLLCLTPDRDEALDALRELGVVHVTDRRPPAGEDLDALRARLTATERALAALPKKAGGRRTRPRAAERLPEAGAALAEVLELLDRREELDPAARKSSAGSSPATTASASSTSTRCARSSSAACGPGSWSAPPDQRLAAPDGMALTELGARPERPVLPARGLRRRRRLRRTSAATSSSCRGRSDRSPRPARSSPPARPAS